jgi:RNA polymerase sigma-70 factor (ECF subfamily)
MGQRKVNKQNNPIFLMRLAKNGDQSAFSQIYELYFTPVFRYIFLRVQNKSDAENLAQDVFLKAYKNIDNFQERNKEPLTLFFTIARNTVIDFWKKKKDIIMEEIEEEISENPLEILEKHDDCKRILIVLEKLNKDQKEVIILKFISGLTNKEISQLLEKSEEAIRQLQSRGLRILRQYFRNEK